MKITNSLLAWALAACVNAQTPSNFSVLSTASLKVIGEPGNVIITPALLVPQSEVLDVPSIFTSPNITADAYVAFMIDPATAAGTFLHWFQPNLVLGTNGNLSVNTTAPNASAAIGASYIYPQPQADGYAHQYVILLYQQPSYWQVPSNYSTINPPIDLYARLSFDMADFQQASGLSAPVGTNYFRVLNGTAEQTSSLATATKTGSGTPTTASVATTTSGGSSASTTSALATVSFTGKAALIGAMSAVFVIVEVGVLALLPLLLWS